MYRELEKDQGVLVAPYGQAGKVSLYRLAGDRKEPVSLYSLPGSRGGPVSLNRRVRARKSQVSL